jgi:hypothetical protein
MDSLPPWATRRVNEGLHGAFITPQDEWLRGKTLFAITGDDTNGRGAHIRWSLSTDDVPGMARAGLSPRWDLIHITPVEMAIERFTRAHAAYDRVKRMHQDVVQQVGPHAARHLYDNHVKPAWRHVEVCAGAALADYHRLKQKVADIMWPIQGMPSHAEPAPRPSASRSSPAARHSASVSRTRSPQGSLTLDDLQDLLDEYRASHSESAPATSSGSRARPRDGPARR